MEDNCQWMWGSFMWGAENILKLDFGDVCTILNISKITGFTLNSVVCELYFSKDVKRTF